MTFLDQEGESGAKTGPPTAADRSPAANDLQWDDESEFVRSRPAGLRILRAVVAAVVLVVIGWTIYTGARDWFSAQLDPDGPPGDDVELVVPAGTTVGALATILESNEVIPNSTFFRYYANFKDFDDFQAGEYTMQQNMSADEAIARLQLGPKQIEVGEFLIVEGKWISEILVDLADQIPSVTVPELEAALESGLITPRYRPEGNDSWEGLLFPAKYFIEQDVTAVEVLAKMSNEFAAVTGELGYGAAERKHGLSAYEVIIIASLIEAEAQTAADRPKIARVIYNRLAQNQSIGIDATLIYGKGVRGEPIFQSELDTPGPFNTRHATSRGLPPTPIAAPSRASLEAAMNPLEGPWLYYVLFDEEGNHEFATTLDEHNANVAIAREKGLLDS